MAETVYVLSAVTSIACAWLLLRGYVRSRVRLLFWSSLCFAGLAINNVALVADLLIFTDIDLGLLRTGSALAGLSLLIFGLVWDAR